MPNILELYQDSLKKENPEAVEQAQAESLQEKTMDEYGQEKGLSFNSNVSGDPQQDEQRIRQAEMNQSLGYYSGINAEPRKTDPGTWSPEYTDRSFAEEAGTSFMRGVGNHFVKGTGDLIQVAGAMMNPALVNGTWLSSALQEMGTEMADKFQSYLPEDLKVENLTWSSMLDPRFWSTHVAEQVPQIIEFILLSKGGSALARNVATRGAKALGGEAVGMLGKAAQTAGGKIVPGTAKGVLGALTTDTGLTQLGKTAVGAVGGGITGNVLAGMQNAAELVNTHKEDKDANGNLLYTNEELAKMATATMRNNLSWVFMDMASWGMTFGGGYKALNKFNPLKRGKSVWTAGQQAKIVSKQFAYDVAPMVKKMGGLLGKGVAEGTEEQFQETFEEWAKKRAFAEATGDDTKKLESFTDYAKDYIDFFKSEENVPTRVLAMASGALAGSAANIGSLINRTAEDTYRLYDRATNLKEITRKQGTEKELQWQDYHINDTIADIVAHGREDLYNEFMEYALQNENVSEEEKNNYDTLFKEYQELKVKGDKLNARGTKALLHNHAIEKSVTADMARFQEIAQENIKMVQENPDLSDNEKTKRIEQIAAQFEKQNSANALLLAEARQNKANLIMGKLASNLSVEFGVDENGVEYTHGGLKQEDYYKFTKEGEKKAPSATKLTIDNLSTKAKKIYNDIVSKSKDLFGKAKDMATKAKDAVVKTAGDINEGADMMAEMDNIKKQFNVNIDKNPEGVWTVTPSGEVDTEGNVMIGEDEQQANVQGAETALNKLINKYNQKTEERTGENLNPEPKKEVPALENPNEPIKEAEWSDYQTTGQANPKTIQSIVDKITNNEDLSEREDVIRQGSRGEINEGIARKKLGLKPRVDKKGPPPEIATLSKKDFNEVQDTYGVKITVNEEGGYDVETNLEGQEATDLEQKVRDDIDNRFQEYVSKLEDGELNEAENAFVKAESVLQTAKTNIKDFTTKAVAKMKSKWRANKKAFQEGFDEGKADKRSGTMDVASYNKAMSLVKKSLWSRLSKMARNNDHENIAQNDLDILLNATANYNENGPSNLHKQSVVNHHLKRMFPDTNNPAQVIVVQNLYESVGSIGLAHSLGMTIYVDEKAFDDDTNFMHEMSHIWYKLAQNEPVVQDIVKKSLQNQALVDDIKNRYDDYTLYNIFRPGQEEIQLTKGRLKEITGFDDDALNKFIKDKIESGDFTTVPLAEQKYLIEEMFVKQLEGPLAGQYDKIFTNKNEPQRKKDKKMFLGLIRKKGEIIENEDGVSKMLKELYRDENLPNTSIKTFLTDTFKAVTKGVTMDSYGLDKRAEDKNIEYNRRIQEIDALKVEQAKNEPESIYRRNLMLDIMEDNVIDGYENGLEQDGVSFYDKDFDTQVKGARRLLRRFGTVYNKALRVKYLNATKDQVVDRKQMPIFDSNLFESVIFNLANELNSGSEFIYQIENSALKEVDAFNRYMDAIFPNTKYALLNSMHYVLSNGKSIGAMKHSLNKGDLYVMEDSLSKTELNKLDRKMDHLYEARGNEKLKIPMSEEYKQLQDAINRIYENNTTNLKDDIITILQTLSPYPINHILDQGFITFQGMSVPIETLIARYIRSGIVFNKAAKPNEWNKKYNDGYYYDQKTGVRQIYYGNLRPLVMSLISTQRKFTPISSVHNAQNNLEPTRIINNHLTKEVDNMINYLAELKSFKQRGKIPAKYQKKNGEFLTLDEIKKEKFMERYSHTNHLPLKERSRNYKHNQLLEAIYDNYQKGILPTITQYHGIADVINDQAQVYKNSTPVEQGLEDFFTFVQTSHKASNPNARTNNYLANIGTFADSPRKFYMNSNRVNFEEVFNPDGTLKKDGAIISSIYRIHKKSFGGMTRGQFGQEFVTAIKETVKFLNNNASVISNKKVQLSVNSRNVDMSKFFNKDGKTLNREGKKLAAEYTINSILQGYNTIDMLSPGITDFDAEGLVTKRFKMNSSPVMSVNNKNFKIEPMFFADEVFEGTDAGTDSAMYILEEDAQKWRNLGYGLFQMNNGFKFLNASVEKENPNFKGRTAYLKGYTTIVGKNHPLYASMKARKDKYNAWHKEKFGTEPSMDLNDGTHNHMVIAMPKSSDKSNFFTPPKGFNETFTEDAIAENNEELMKLQDKLYYTSGGNFRGIESYNFGPQQVMDKNHTQSNTPVQMVNSVIVNARMNGQEELANKIQKLISQQKMKNLQKIVDIINGSDQKQLNELIKNGLNLEDMNQAQRILIMEKGGSTSHPYVVEIITNQLAKTIRRTGNKLSTPGTLAHQKPDSGWRTQAVGNSRLNGYTKNLDGTTAPAEIVLPKGQNPLDESFNGKKQDAVSAREEFTFTTHKDALNRIAREKKSVSHDDKLKALKSLAINKARQRHNVSVEEAQNKWIGEVKTKTGQVVGYYAKGDLVIASRVPGHGPATTGVFEVVGFQETDGNQVSVSGQFNEIIGSDNDGDALFIQYKAPKNSKKFKNYGDWNEAFDLITQYWLSPEMSQQITTKIDVKATLDPKGEESTIISRLKDNFQQKKRGLPFSPVERMTDYNNTMISKRNVGPAFNIHKVANVLAATEVRLQNPLSINGVKIEGFQDTTAGANSRNHASAVLANTILDNAKYGYADIIGLNESNINQAIIMVNLGVPIETIGNILNSEAAQDWSNEMRNNNNIYYDDVTKDRIYRKLLRKYSTNSKPTLEVEADLSTDKGKRRFKSKANQANIIELLNNLGNVNSEVQTVSKIMSGHSRIHVNPLVLENQITKAKNLLTTDPRKSTASYLIFNEEFRTNPDLQNYIEVAEVTLKGLKKVNPVYDAGTNKVLGNIVSKIGRELTDTQIEELSKDFLLFNTSRLLGLNNKPREYAVNLLSKDPNNKESIYYKVKKYTDDLKKQSFNDNKGDLNYTYSLEDTSVLFAQALNYELEGNADRAKYIVANNQFTNNTLSEELRNRARDEFEQLPRDLRNDLIMYDLLTNGWSGSKSLSLFFGEETNSMIHFASDYHRNNKNQDIGAGIQAKLEKIIALNYANKKSNPFEKVMVNKNLTKESLLEAILETYPNTNRYRHSSLVDRMSKGLPTYINVINKGKRLLFEMPEFTPAEKKLILNRRGTARRELIREMALQKIEEVQSETPVIDSTIPISQQHNLNVATISDNNTGSPYNAPETPQKSKSLDYLVESAINYEEAMRKINREGEQLELGLDAREDYYIDTFAKESELTRAEYDSAMEYSKFQSESSKAGQYSNYQVAKKEANAEYEENKDKYASMTNEQLLAKYKEYGEKDVYAYARPMKPVLIQLAKNLANVQSKLHKNIQENGQDISAMKAYLMSGSNVPGNHPATQSMVRMFEAEYKSFINEKKRYMGEMEKITDRLYKEKLGYTSNKNIFSREGFVNIMKRLRDAITKNRTQVYERLYGPLVTREEYINKSGTLVIDYKLKTPEEVQAGFEGGWITEAQKDFYDFFKKTTAELKPANVKELQNYIPHTSMSKLETLSSRGLLGLMANSRTEQEALNDVEMTFNGEKMTWKNIEDQFKMIAANPIYKNDFTKIKEYRALKKKALKLLKSGKNEDGSDIQMGTVFTNTALGFGAINRFSNNRSVKATELPSMDLNKALGDYIHSTLFVHGNEKFQGFEKLQGYLDGVLAYNQEKGYENLNKHVQKVWKDYFLRGRRQESVFGKKADKVINSLTRLNLFYALGYQANKNTGGLYALGNIMVGKYHNIKDLGGRAWLQGEARYWGLDKGFQGGLSGIMQRHKRMQRILKNMNFMDINVYDEVNIEKKTGLDSIFADLALMPMIKSEEWIQRTHMLGMLTDEELDRFDDNGKLKEYEMPIDNYRLTELEDRVKSQHGRGYQPTDQRAVQMYSWGSAALQFSRFIPTMVHDRFARKDVNIYGKEHIGSLRAVADMVRHVVNNPNGFVEYRNSLSEEMRQRLDSGLKGMAMSTVIAMFMQNDTANDLYWDANYYFNHPKLAKKLTPPPIQTTINLVNQLF